MQLTLKIGTFPVGVADLILVYQEVCVQLGVLNGHGSQRQIVRSVVWHGEDTCCYVISVTDVTEDNVKQDGIVNVERYASAQRYGESNVWNNTKLD